jgi:hypothetical protein
MRIVASTHAMGGIPPPTSIPIGIGRPRLNKRQNMPISPPATRESSVAASVRTTLRGVQLTSAYHSSSQYIPTNR